MVFELITAARPFISFLAIIVLVIGGGVFLYSVVFRYNPSRIAASVMSVVAGAECLLYALPVSWFI